MHANKVLLEIMLGSFDLSITATAAWTMAATAFLCIILIAASRKPGLVPTDPLQNILEYAVEFTGGNILDPAGLDRKTWTPLFLSLFLFILFNNLSGLIPGAKASTGNINATAALALMVFVLGNFLRIKRGGVLAFFRGLVPEGVSGPILILVVPIEFISQLAKPFSLAVRLFANLTGGHLIILTLFGFIVLYKNIIVGSISFVGVLVMSLFEIFIAVIQAYVFAFLSAMLVSECLEHHGEGKTVHPEKIRSSTKG